MANVRWIGAYQDTKQVNTITPANVAVGNTFTVTINGKSYTFTATAGTVANVTAGLQALLAASTEGEFSEITWADATTAITGTAKTAGKPFTQTSTAAGGTATLTTSTTTANTSKNDINAGANWSGAAVPGADDVFVDNHSVDLLYNLGSLSAVTFTTLNILQSFSATVGLPERAGSGTGAYEEYRARYFAVGASTINIGSGPGSGSGRIMLNNGSVQTLLNQFNSGSPLESTLKAVVWKGTHISNVVNVFGGSLDVAPFGGETAVIATLRVGDDQAGNGLPPDVRCSAGVTLTTIRVARGTVELNSAFTTLNQFGGEVLATAGNITTAEVESADGSGATFRYRGNGTIANLNIGDGAVVDFSEVQSGCTVTNCNVYGVCTILDPNKRVTWTNGINFNHLDPAKCTLSLGSNLKLTPASL